MNEIQVINLPSFLRKSLRAFALKSLIRSYGVDLYRVGRSRNWQMKATSEQLINIIEAIESADEPSWLWLAKNLKKERASFTYDALLSIAKKNSGITVNELVSKTDCTVAEARKVLDDLEWSD